MMNNLLIFAGKSGTGKTTLARVVAKTLMYPYFDYDTLVKPFLDEIEKRYGGDKPRYNFLHDWRETSYITLWNVIIENLQMGLNAVLSAPLTCEMEDEGFYENLRALLNPQTTIRLFYLAPPRMRHLEMLNHRGLDRDKDIVGDMDFFMSHFSPVLPAWPRDKMIYLDSGDFEINLKYVISFLETGDNYGSGNIEL